METDKINIITDKDEFVKTEENNAVSWDSNK